MTKHTDPVDVSSDDVSSFVAGVLNTLRYWRDAHTDAESFAESWLDYMDGDTTVDVESGIEFSNNYFSVEKKDLKTAIVKEIALNCTVHFYHCPACGYVGEDSVCDNCDDYENELEEASLDTVEEYLSEFQDYTAIDFNIVFNVVRDFVFPIYFAAVSPVFADVLERVEYYISKIENTEDRFDTLAAVVEALGIHHVNGEIFEDYISYGMYGVDEDDINDMRNHGITEFFHEDDVKEYLDS